MPENSPNPINKQRLRTPLKVALTYVIAAGLWILFSDMVLSLFISDPGTLTRLQTYKGWLFVTVTGLLLYVCLRHNLHRELKAEALPNQLHQALAGAGIGESYFTFLANQLTEMFDIDCCMIGEWTADRESVNILAIAPDGHLENSTIYGLAGTPCQEVLKQNRTHMIPAGAGATYPQADLFQVQDSESYIGVPLLDSGNKVIGLLAVVSSRPIKEIKTLSNLLEACASRAGSELQRVRSDRHLREQFNQFATLFDSINAIVYVADMETYQLLYINRYAAEQFGSVWENHKCFSYLQEDRSSPCEFCTNKNLLVDGEPGPAVIWEFCNTRNKHWYQCIDKAIRWPDGRLVRMEIALDITERKDLEKIKDDLLSAVSHEMRTPLTAIIGFAELLLEDENLPKHVLRHIETIFNESEKLGDLINTFIDVRRFKTDRARVDYVVQPLRPILEKTITTCRDNRQNHLFSINCAEEIPVFGNNREITQVLSQLVSNACRYSPEGGDIVLSAEVADGSTHITISDQGIGIPQEELHNIFDRFYRLDTGDTRKTGGTGLGLTLAREIVTLHGGRIWVESRPGVGSHFFISLPLPAETPLSP